MAFAWKQPPDTVVSYMYKRKLFLPNSPWANFTFVRDAPWQPHGTWEQRVVKTCSALTCRSNWDYTPCRGNWTRQQQARSEWRPRRRGTDPRWRLLLPIMFSTTMHGSYAQFLLHKSVKRRRNRSHPRLS